MAKSNIKYTHFTNFGASLQPPCANGSGFIPYRENFYSIPREEWTPGERWIAAQEARLDAWRRSCQEPTE